MNWRKKNRLNEILNEDFTYFRENYPIFQQAFDKDGRIGKNFCSCSNFLAYLKYRSFILNVTACCSCEFRY